MFIQNYIYKFYLHSNDKYTREDIGESVSSKIWFSFIGNWSDRDCLQSPIFSWDGLDIPHLIVTAILIFKCTEGTGVGDYSSRAGGWGAGGAAVMLLQSLYFSRLLPNRPCPLSTFDTHARWQPVTQSARSRWSYGIIEDCEQSRSDTVPICALPSKHK